MKPADDFIAAIHEGGHCCVGQMFGFSVRHVVLHAVGARQDEAGHCELRDHMRELDEDPTRYLVYLLSGAAAEKRHVGRYSARDENDLELAVIAASVVLQVERDSPRVGALVRDAQAIANAMMLDDALWRWVERTAKALIAKRRLTGRDIQLLREAR